MSLARATRGRSVDRSRSTHATPRSKPLHSRSHHHQMQLPTTCPVIESKVCDHQCPCAACEDMHATYTLRTMWRVSESCVHACLDTRRLTSDIERVQRAQSARRRALQPTLPRRCCVGAQDGRAEGLAAAERLKLFSSRLVQCDGQPARPSHCSFD